MHPRRDRPRRPSRLERTDLELPQHLTRRIPTSHNNPPYAGAHSRPPNDLSQRTRHLPELIAFQLISVYDDAGNTR